MEDDKVPEKEDSSDRDMRRGPTASRTRAGSRRGGRLYFFSQFYKYIFVRKIECTHCVSRSFHPENCRECLR